MARSRRPLALLSIAAALAMLFTTAAPAAADPLPGTPGTSSRLMDGVALYRRAFRLAHAGSDNGTIVASVVTFADGQGLGAIFESTDHGESFQRIGTVKDPGTTEGLCCATLYELPQQVGDLPEGTLLWSASVGQDGGDDRRMSLPVWASNDGGRTWRYLSTVATSANFGGLWEPEFAVSEDGRLVVYVSDESQQPTYSQTLVQSTSTDGLTWTPLRNIVAADDPALRPGMPVVRRLPSGSYLMSYEICGPGEDCRQRLRRSTDGVHWGRPSLLGQRVESVHGLHFRHAPTLTWYDDGTADGRLLTIGQMTYTDDGEVAPGNGNVVLYNEQASARGWQSTEAAVTINDPYDNYCPNYSSALVPMHERNEVLGLSSAYDEQGVCSTYFRVVDLPGPLRNS